MLLQLWWERLHLLLSNCFRFLKNCHIISPLYQIKWHSTTVSFIDYSLNYQFSQSQCKILLRLYSAFLHIHLNCIWSNNKLFIVPIHTHQCTHTHTHTHRVEDGPASLGGLSQIGCQMLETAALITAFYEYITFYVHPNTNLSSSENQTGQTRTSHQCSRKLELSETVLVF